MKKYILIVALFIQGLFTQAQENKLYEFKVKYDMQLNFFSLCNFKATLYFNETQSLFEYQETSIEKEFTEEEINQKLNEGDNLSINIRSKDTVRHVIEYNRNDNLIKECIMGFNKKYYQVKESAPKVEWNISEEHKKVDIYECTKATCSFRGRNYIVWFTTAIQTNFGPLKLHGLPGLILELTDEKREIFLSARVVKKEENYIKNDPIGTTIISYTEYQKIKAEDIKKVEEIMKRVSSKSARGFTISAKINSVKSIEME